MSLLKRAQPAQPDPVTLPATPAPSAMEARMNELELQIKYPKTPAESLKILAANEKRDAKQRAGEDEHMIRVAAAHERREQHIRDTAKELLKNGNLKIMVDGVQVHTLNDQNALTCPDCGTVLQDTGILIYTLSERWIAAGGDVNRLAIRDARGPLSQYVGMPCIFTPSTCRACRSSHQILIQLCLIV